MRFTVQDPDFELSVKTGMTRRHWIEAGKFLLEGVFQHVKSFEEPIAIPKRPGKTYPQPDDPEWKFRSAEFEGLARTFMIGAPVIANQPDAEVAGYKLRDYYAELILRSTDPGSETFVGFIGEMAEQFGNPLFQHTAEGAALVLGLMMSREQIWDRYTDAQRDQIATLLSEYFHQRTNSHNWRWFNVLMGSFLENEGYEIDRAVLVDHLQNLSAFYAGDGWYRDMGQFDYYSCWAFQFYAPIWCSVYGFEKMPDQAAVFQRRHVELQKTYPRMFSRQGHSLMWGRSIIYRCAASAPLAVAGRLQDTQLDFGWARRIASGNLLQFLTREELFVDGVPSLGFYGTFEPLVQSYSCAISPFWLAKVFLALDLPDDHPFWTEPEHDGEWAELTGQQTTVLDGPGLAVTNHAYEGTTELRPGKVPGGKKGNPNYTRLVYNTSFPWEDDSPTGAFAGTYCCKQTEYADMDFLGNQNIKYVGFRDGVLYRTSDLPGWLARVDLAEIILPGGVLRVDRVSLPFPHQLHLGHFAIPHVDGRTPSVSIQEKDGRIEAICRGTLRQVALVAYRGWEGIDAAEHTGLHPETEKSTVLYAHRSGNKPYGGMIQTVTLMLHRPDTEKWIDQHLDPVDQIELLEIAPSGQPCGANIRLHNGKEYTVDYGDLFGQI
jgi:hypothetical protein